MLKKQPRLLALLLFLAIGVPSLRAAEESVPTGYSVSVEFSPSKDNPETFLLRAQINDLATNKTLAVQRVIAKLGDPGKLKIGTTAALFWLDFLLDKSGKTGTYTFTAFDSGKTVAMQKCSVTIQ